MLVAICAIALLALCGPILAQSTLFKTNRAYYPSNINPNFLPTGTLIKAANKPDIFYVLNGKKSWVLPSIAARWFGENHFFKSDIVVNLSAEDLARYPQTSSVNPLYIGKILRAPNGTQYAIDDKLRKRELSAAVRAALKIPAGNLYPTSTAHLKEFPTGPAVLADRYPGGTVVYTGPYHGGQMWRIKENAGGKLTKHLYLSDYLYEADYNPDESFRIAANPKIFARYERGDNIEKYPDGWVVGLNKKTYVVQGGQLRHVISAAIFSAMGYNPKYVLTKFPEFLKRYPQGQPIAAFKSIVSGVTEASKPKSAPNAANNLVRVRPTVRQPIADINNVYISVYDKEPSAAENKFWVDYVYNGEVNNRADLIKIMKIAAKSGKHPVRTSRTSRISLANLSSHWFSYLFYFVHQSEPNEADRNYWLGRINDSDLYSIEKLGGALQWVKDNLSATRR